MITFKKIDFENYNKKWIDEQLFVNKKPIFKSYYSYGELHDEIRKHTKALPESDIELFEIIYSIQKWGGVTGRYFLIKRNGISYFDSFKTNKKQIEIYRKASKLAMLGNPEAFNLFCSIRGINVSFAGKHAYFWSPKKNPLIIIDKLLAKFFGHNTPQSFIKEIGGYSNVIDFFNTERKNLGLKDILTLERGIFQYVRESHRKI
jgi:hypothetical protein